ncbi:E3 ubiquitin-protein ligase TRIM45-like [Amphiura filiformis]|uniref:E3 ubiquitin-protein ligase TRIM45-like n=1 Tax=Amphiura filiformis TaxID=82378 RepID=UPI003B226077
MADSLKLVEKLDREFLECGICLDRFTTPRGLPCLHSFCHGCLVKYCKGRKRILCPNCKRPTTVPKKGVAGFPPHFMVNSLQETVHMERLKIQTAKDTKCSNCNEEKATVRCLNCSGNLCNKCHMSHNAWKPFKQHKVVNIEDIPSDDVPVETAHDQTCEDHGGETKRFYCETCQKLICRDCIVMKPHCRDHDYVTLKEASEKYAAKLNDRRSQGEALKQKCHDAIQKTESVKNCLEENFNDAAATLESIEKKYKQQVEVIVAKHKTHVNDLREQRLNVLDETSEKLQASLNEVKNACDLASNVTQMGSDYDITSTFATLSTSLKKFYLLETASPALGYIKIEGMGEICVADVVKVKDSEKWEQVDQFSTNYLQPWGITLHPDGDIAVTDGIGKDVNIFSQYGQVKYRFNYPFGSVHVDLLDIAITPDNRYILPGKGSILFFDDRGTCSMLAFTANTYDMNNKPADPWCLTVDSEGRIIAGIGGTTISIHETNGEFISKFPAPLAPCSRFALAATSSGHIAAAVGNSRQDQYSVMILDYLGNTIKEIQPPHGFSSWDPTCICCSKQGELFIMQGRKGVYRYEENGAHCLGCIISDLDDPTKMTISDDGQKLFVTEYTQRMVKIFRRP